jgi:ligand-binding sensor domain-containing protein
MISEIITLPMKYAGKKISMRAYFYFLVLLMQVPFPVFSQQKNIQFQHLQTDAGLSHSDILCIMQDSRGFMWFGTEDGLNKYDGYKFIVYKNNRNKNSLSDNYINDLKEDTNGDIWIATLDGGLNKYDRQKNTKIKWYKKVDYFFAGFCACITVRCVTHLYILNFIEQR